MQYFNTKYKYPDYMSSTYGLGWLVPNVDDHNNGVS